MFLGATPIVTARVAQDLDLGVDGFGALLRSSLGSRPSRLILQRLFSFLDLDG